MNKLFSKEYLLNEMNLLTVQMVFAAMDSIVNSMFSKQESQVTLTTTITLHINIIQLKMFVPVSRLSVSAFGVFLFVCLFLFFCFVFFSHFLIPFKN